MAGAKLILVGTINQIRTERRAFQGYGIATERTVATAEVRVRLVEVETAQIVFSRTATGSAEKLETSGVANADSDFAYSLVRSAVESIAADDGFTHAVRGAPTNTIQEKP
jgi:curli biogenesis system outer membrane secretion channel CsgG